MSQGGRVIGTSPADGSCNSHRARLVGRRGPREVSRLGLRACRVGEAANPGPGATCKCSLEAVRGTPVPCGSCGVQCPRGMLAHICEMCGRVCCMRCGAPSGECEAMQGQELAGARADRGSGATSTVSTDFEGGRRQPGNDARATDSAGSAIHRSTQQRAAMHGDVQAADHGSAGICSNLPEPIGAPVPGSPLLHEAIPADAAGIPPELPAEQPACTFVRRQVTVTRGAVCVACGAHRKRGSRIVRCSRCSDEFCNRCAPASRTCRRSARQHEERDVSENGRCADDTHAAARQATLHEVWGFAAAEQSESAACVESNLDELLDQAVAGPALPTLVWCP